MPKMTFTLNVNTFNCFFNTPMTKYINNVRAIKFG